MTEFESRLRSTVENLCATERNTGRCPEGLARAAGFIEQEFRDMGLQVSRQEFETDGVLCANVEAVSVDFRGTHCPHLVIGAHYDSAPGTVGADDNASAVAVLLETARALPGNPSGASLRFVAYANEEPPHFCSKSMGSRVHARACRAREDNLLGMICLESLGVFTNEPDSQTLGPIEFLMMPEDMERFFNIRGISPSVGNFLALVGNGPSSDFLQAFEKTFPHDQQLPVISSDFLGELLRLSDHLAYWDEGYPAIMLTDTAMCRNPHYHRATDKPDHLNYPTMALLTQRLIEALPPFWNSLSGTANETASSRSRVGMPSFEG